MKLRYGFVSNSSSSSFVASLAKLSEFELKILEEAAIENGWSFHINENTGLVTGWTSMCNGELPEALKNLGLNKVRFE